MTHAGQARVLEAEDALDFVPEREQQDKRCRDEEDHGCEEPKTRAGLLAAPLDSDPPASAVKPVGAVDRFGVDRWIVGSRRNPAGCLCHSAGFYGRRLSA